MLEAAQFKRELPPRSNTPSANLCFFTVADMTRGNQRDTDRARAAKRAEAHGKTAKEKDGLSKEARMLRDAEALKAKQAAKAAAKAAGN
jgi:hypothetical protein